MYIYIYIIYIYIYYMYIYIYILYIYNRFKVEFLFMLRCMYSKKHICSEGSAL